ncbi:hypothetical protein [Streptomyces litchfieldiae]|uniref:Uncharacterized protein n=1 Tax=Streptomyces litchfieldiae TaxID=3075543 RepID=A0ABU2ML51_9ACTN|nr:hypothetical protein [Streptomyces sp. DSM 44938]MDT0342341.1 hypothetical protein [Streptomyces sp. DSM 44938]
MGNGAAIKDFLASHPVDEHFANDAAVAPTTVTDETSAAWHDD